MFSGILKPWSTASDGRQDKDGSREMTATGHACGFSLSSSTTCKCRTADGATSMFTHRTVLEHESVSRRSFRHIYSRPRALLLLMLLFLVDVGMQQAHGASLPGSSSPSMPSLPSMSGNQNTDPLARLSKVFGIKRIPGKIVHRTPPQYMTELYKSVADKSGLTKSPGPYNANTVRSFPDRDTIHQEHFFYNVSHLQGEDAEEERMLEAEFHVFKMKPRPTRSAEAIPPHHVLLKVYQVLDVDNMYSPAGLRLVDAQRISTHAHGWFTFKVTKAVENWRLKLEENLGLLVTAQSSKGQHYNGSYIRFAQRNQHHDSKQPILVVFTDDGTTRHPTFVSPEDRDYQRIQEETRQRNLREQAEEKSERTTGPAAGIFTTSTGFSRNTDFRQAVRLLNERARHSRTSLPAQSSPAQGKKRWKREAGAGTGGGGRKKKRQGGRRKRMYDVSGYRYRRSCSKHKMYVDFDEIGWSGWIISPKGYDAYHCSGDCPFPLGQSQKPTNHATVQSIVHALRVSSKHVGTPCCVPSKLFSISLLYFDDDENVILKQYDDMVAASCGCH